MSYTANVSEDTIEYRVDLMSGDTVGETHNLPKDKFGVIDILGVIIPWIATDGYTNEDINDSNYVMPKDFVNTYITNNSSIDLDTPYNSWRDSL